MKDDQRETVALCLEAVADAVRRVSDHIITEAMPILAAHLSTQAKALRPSPSSAPVGGTLELYVWHGSKKVVPDGKWERIPQAEAVLDAARRPGEHLYSDEMDAAVSAFTSTRYGINANADRANETVDPETAMRRCIEAAIGAYFRDALSALDNRRAG